MSTVCADSIVGTFTALFVRQILGYCKVRFDSNGVTTARVASKNDRYNYNIPYRKYAHHISYRICLLTHESTSIRSPSLQFLDGFQGSISIAIKSGSTVGCDTSIATAEANM